MDSSRIGLLGQGCVALLLAASAGCSSSSSSSAAPTQDGGGGDASLNVVVDGGGAACTPTYPLTVGALVTLNVTWPAKAAVAKGSGVVYISLLSTYSATSDGKFTGTTVTCGDKSPDITLSQPGDIATGVPTGQTGQVQINFPASSWANAPSTAITGQLGGTNVGSSFEIDPVVTLYGLSPTSVWSDGTKAWPAEYSGLSVSDYTTIDGGPYDPADDGGAPPGVLGIPNGNPPYYLPKTGLGTTFPSADQLNIVLRTELSLYGLSSSCDNISGTATVAQLNNHVVGCQLADPAPDAGPCDYGFIDSNTTQYAPAAGTFVAQKLATGATCSDVLTALPIPAQ